MAGEIVLLMGPPGGGKSTLVKAFVDKGYERLNRDLIGGGLQDDALIYRELRKKYAAGGGQFGARNFVLDNTYATIDSRKPIIALGKELGLPVRAVVLGTTAEQAQFFAARRQIQKYGRLLRAAEYKDPVIKKDPNAFPPVAQFAYWKRKEDPTTAEGLVAVETVPVKIELGPEYKHSAIILDYDGTLRDTKSGRKYPRDPKDVYILPGRTEKLKALLKQGYLLVGASNQSGCAKDPSEEKYVSVAEAEACFAETNRLLALGFNYNIDVQFSQDAAGVPPTYWPKPMPGMGVLFIEKYKLDPALCICVGDRGTDRTFAQRSGFQFANAEDFFR